MEKGSRLNRNDIAFLTVLVLTGIKYVYNIDAGLDISLYDESVYLSVGAGIPETGFPPAEYSPLYALWYYFLSLFQSNPLRLFYLNISVLTVALPVCFYLALRSRNVAFIPSTIMTFLLGISYANLNVMPKPAHLAALTVLLFFFLSSYMRKDFAIYSLGIAASLIMTFIRPEFSLSFVLLISAYIVIIIKDRKELNLKSLFMILLVGAFSFYLIYTFGFPIGGDREYFAFSQHFAKNWTFVTNSNLNPWTEHSEITSRYFGNSKNIFEAFISNPAVFILHILFNLIQTFVYLVGSFSMHTNILLPKGMKFAIIEAMIFIFSAIFILVKKKIKIKNILYDISQIDKSVNIALLIFIFPCIISAVIIFPRNHYLLVPAALTALILCPIIFSKNERDYSFKDIIVLGIIFLLLMPYFNEKSSSDLANLKTIKAVESLNIKKGVGILEAEGGYNIYLGENFKRIPTTLKNEKFYSFIKNYSADIIISSDRLNKDIRFDSDSEWSEFKTNYDSYNYFKIVINGGKREIFVKNSIVGR